jgi:hypothetical protein
VNFNANFNVLLSKYIVHPLVKIKDFDNIKMHGTTVKMYTVHCDTPITAKMYLNKNFTVFYNANTAYLCFYVFYIAFYITYNKCYYNSGVSTPSYT